MVYSNEFTTSLPKLVTLIKALAVLDERAIYVFLAAAGARLRSPAQHSLILNKVLKTKINALRTNCFFLDYCAIT